jgi:hypothetical protein
MSIPNDLCRPAGRLRSEFVWKQLAALRWLDYSEDLIFDFRIVGMYGPFVFQPNAVVYFRPRPNLRAFFKQYHLYARGDGKANLFPRRHIIRYLTYFGVLPLIILGTLMGNLFWLALLGPGAVYMIAPAYRRLVNHWDDLSWPERFIAALWVPVIRITGDIAKMVGYPGGRLWRFQNHPQWRSNERGRKNRSSARGTLPGWNVMRGSASGWGSPSGPACCAPWRFSSPALEMV